MLCRLGFDCTIINKVNYNFSMKTKSSDNTSGLPGISFVYKTKSCLLVREDTHATIISLKNGSQLPDAVNEGAIIRSINQRNGKRNTGGSVTR